MHRVDALEAAVAMALVAEEIPVIALEMASLKHSRRCCFESGSAKDFGPAKGTT